MLCKTGHFRFNYAYVSFDMRNECLRALDMFWRELEIQIPAECDRRRRIEEDSVPISSDGIHRGDDLHRDRKSPKDSEKRDHKNRKSNKQQSDRNKSESSTDSKQTKPSPNEGKCCTFYHHFFTQQRAFICFGFLGALKFCTFPYKEILYIYHVLEVNHIVTCQNI